MLINLQAVPQQSPANGHGPAEGICFSSVFASLLSLISTFALEKSSRQSSDSYIVHCYANFLHCKVQAGNLETRDISRPAFHFLLLKARSNIQKEIQFALFIFAQHKFRLSLADFCVVSQGPRLCSRPGSECTYYLLIYGVQFSSELSACCKTDKSNPPSPLDLKLDWMSSRSLDVTSFLARNDKSCVPV